MLGERDLREVGVDGTDEEEKEQFDGYGSLNWAADSEGNEVLVRRMDVGTFARAFDWDPG